MRASSSSVFHLWAGEVGEFDGVDYLWLGVYVLREGGGAGICVMGVVKARVHLSELLFSNRLYRSRGDLSSPWADSDSDRWMRRRTRKASVLVRSRMTSEMRNSPRLV